MLKKFLLILFFATTIVLSATSVVSAAGCTSNTTTDCIQLKPAIPGVTTVPQLIGTVIRGALGVVGAITLLIFIRGASAWLTSAGNAEQIESGTQTMIWAALGLVVIFASYFLVDALFSYLLTNS